ncbi:MAG TPA: ORF6N domain-containing protein [Bacteroidia bacterium]|nr:ORF6N domain-containing protein [Bacteroidia bacterium]
MKKITDEISVADEFVLSKIYLLRGHKIMLDSDLAGLYGVETKRLKEQVKRNITRFPSDFMFQLTLKEFEILRSQIATSSWGGARHLPMAFTEQGVAMLSSVLNSEKAIEVNIIIIRVFTKIRQTIMDVAQLRLAFEEIKKKTENNTKNIEVVFQYLDELLEKNKKSITRQKIGYRVSKK